MNRVMRNLVAAAVAAGIVLAPIAPATAGGAASSGRPAAVAGADHGTAKGHKAKHAKVGAKARAKGKAGKQERALTRRQRRIARTARLKEVRLRRISDLPKVERLGESVLSGVLANIVADRATLGDLRSSVAAATGQDLTDLARRIRSVRPERYHVIVNQLRLVMRTAGQDAASRYVDELDALVATLLTCTATTPRADLRAAMRKLAGIREAMEEATEETQPDVGEDATATP